MNQASVEVTMNHGAPGASEDRTAIQRLLDRSLTADDLREATARIAHPLAPPEQHRDSLLVFLLQSERCALPLSCVQRVTRPATVHSIPHRTKKVLRGFCNLDGDLPLCIDLASLLGLEADQDTGQSDRRPHDQMESRRMIVVGDRQGVWAVEVDQVTAVAHCDPATYRPPPITVQQTLNRFTSALASLDDQLVCVLDVARLLAGFEATLP